jgi:chorismate dehydratase
MRIARIDNISGAAYRLIQPDFPVVWLEQSPAETTEAMARGRCDAALLPVAELPRLAGLIKPLGPYGIAARGPVRSVLLLSRCPVEEIERVYITPQSRTARALFLTLCRVSYGAEPMLVADPSQADARVVIGDEALLLSLENEEPVTVDLPEWWHRATGLPFVFAQWVVRRSASEKLRERLRAWLERCAAFAEAPAGREAMSGEVLRLGYSQAFALEYYAGIQYRLDSEHGLAMAAFLSLQERGLPWAMNG